MSTGKMIICSLDKLRENNLLIQLCTLCSSARLEVYRMSSVTPLLRMLLRTCLCPILSHTSFLRRHANIILDTVHCLMRHFGSSLCFRPHVIGYQYTDNFFIALGLVATVGIEPQTVSILKQYAVMNQKCQQ